MKKGELSPIKKQLSYCHTVMDSSIKFTKSQIINIIQIN